MSGIAYLSALLALAASAAGAGETPETILIRQTLGADLSGRRRGDAELVLSAYDERFASYDARHSADPRAWEIAHESREAFARHLRADLDARRYEIERTIPSIQVRGQVATATTIDSGRVIERQSHAARAVRIKRFWTLLKREERWKITAAVSHLGDGSGGASDAEEAGEIAAVLEREARGRAAGDREAIAALFDEHFSGYDGKNALDPAKWKLIFSGREELEKHLERRLPYVHYQIERHIVQARVGAQGREALAITREEVSASHELGPATHRLERYVLWTLSKRDGTWKITNMLYNLGLSE